ncbi:hypothetical protein [Bradyrhizobium sp. WYCCWR 12699]|uniref:hypothetical protein n=1 Tax=Bradyrhizobium sp. WYCCWR 12699 TaxID=3064203 RepID=UPI0028A344A6|nr:hypothetical protein [Bradyrhizobium sp. WYCCWR 12699]MDT4737074.1 hypothetical protein [Bradyrhizobium sp. WYCCWR 12699]
MSILRFIDAEGREQDVHDVDHLYELIQARHVGYDSLVWSDEEGRWLAARDHKFFRRIREIAAASPVPPQPWSSPTAAPLQPWSAPPPLPSQQSERMALPPKVFNSPLVNPAAYPASAEPDASKSKWFNAIQTPEEALKTIKDSSTVFFFIAILQGAIGIWMGTQYPDVGFDVGETVIDVVLYAVCAAWLRWGRSRVAAVILLIAATTALGATISTQLKIYQGGGKNIVLALIVFWTAIKSVEATFKLRGRFKQAATATEPPLG